MNLYKFVVDLIINNSENSKKPKYIAIFGAGNNGILLHQHLKDCDVNVNFFCDNNIKKQDNNVSGVPCVSFNELCKYKNDTVVFVSPFKSEQIMCDLKREEFPYVISSDILKLFRFIPKVKEINALIHFPYFGHFYSLYPDIDEIMEKSDSIFNRNKEVQDIDFNEEEQLLILKQMTNLYSSIPKWIDVSDESVSTQFRHRLANPSLSTGDAVGLHCMLRILRPNRMIEVGSGYTSAVTLDTNEFYLNNHMDITFIEPFPYLLKSIIKDSDDIKLVEKGLQDVPIEFFQELQSGDILFIDSTHVSKINSDVNYLFFEILPTLKKGVYIHLHDIFYPFEYPKQWIFNGMIWNELYLLRAFLQNNSNYKIVFFQNMMEQKHLDVFSSKWPLNNPIHGGSLWLKKVK